MWLTVGECRFAITVTDNAAARAFTAQLPLTLDMSELNGNEKHADRNLRTWCPHGLAHTSTRADADRHGGVWTRAARRRTDRGDPRR